MSKIIKYETAKLAKEKGIIEWRKLSGSNHYFYNMETKDLIKGDSFAKMLYYHAFNQEDLMRYLREEENIHIYLHPNLRKDDKIFYDVSIYDVKSYTRHRVINETEYPTYEEALEVGLFKALHFIRNKNSIFYKTRYSDSDKPDKFGRWAVIALSNDIRIAWISKIEDKFSLTCYFPTLNNDAVHENKVCDTLDECKEFIEKRFKWFKKEIL